VKSLLPWLAGALLVVAGAVRAEDLEPAVRTSTAATPDTPAETPAPVAASAPAPAAAPPAAAAKASATPAPGASGAARGERGAKVMDRLELETTQITGNKELPKVMYVVPWRRPDLGEFAGKPPNSLLDELLTPVDRDVFRRQNRYFSALQPDAKGAGPASASGDHSPAAAKDEKDEK
jgi:hypothetical protein